MQWWQRPTTTWNPPTHGEYREKWRRIEIKGERENDQTHWKAPSHGDGD
jgi:hypothetical protein